MTNFKQYATWVIMITLFMSTACKKKQIEPVTPTTNTIKLQPQPDNTEIELGRLIGFWDFKNNGTNSISEQCGNWILEDVSFEEDVLIF